MHSVSDPHTLGQRIAGLRHAQGWSQRRLAEAAGVSHGYVAQLELGRLPSPGKFRLDAIAHALNLRTSDALFNELALPAPLEPPSDEAAEDVPNLAVRADGAAARTASNPAAAAEAMQNRPL